MREKIKIAIIDSGINTSHPILLEDRPRGFSFDGEGKMSDSFEDENGHGTAIYGIVREIREQADIYNIKIWGKEDTVNEEALIHALKYLEGRDFELINISAGINISQHCLELQKVCDRLVDKGVVIVSAFDNSNSISYPAAFENVIGVTSGAHCRQKSDLEYVENNLINVCGKGSVQRLLWKKPEYVMMGGNSFACAHVCVEIAKIMLEGRCAREELLNRVKRRSKYCYKFPKRNESKAVFPPIHRAALFPFNKEMHSLVRYADLLSFEIEGVYDIKYSPHIGATTSHLLNDESLACSCVVQNIRDLHWERIDTLILGHLDEIASAINQNGLKGDLLRSAAEHHVAVYAFDDVSELMGEIETPLVVFCPKVNEDDLGPDPFGKLYRISKPVAGIFGTSSRQGKFTLQLALRRLFLEAGYNLGQIGSEPSALLYGMDSVFPMGYNSSVHIKEFDVVRYLNSEVNRLCVEEKELILVGSQSGTVQYDVGNTAQFNIPQYLFLLGTQPDCVVLCVNPFDELDFIERTVSFIESAVNCKVISIVVFPMDYKYNWAGLFGGKERISEEQYNRLHDKIEEKLKLPVYQLGAEDDMVAVANGIAEFFAAAE